MLYRRFGKTGLQMPVISAGFMRCMQQWRDLPLSAIAAPGQANMEAVVHRALELGITHLETARAYGSSERQLGLILPNLQRDSFMIQTKVQPTAEPQEFVQQIEDSLKRLNLHRLDLLAIHGINDHRSFWYACRPHGCLAAARRLQEQGRIGHIGFSGHGHSEIILEAVRHEGDGGFDYVNLHWYYIFQQLEQALIEARQRDLGVFIISPTDKGGRLQAPPPQLVELSRPLSPMLFNDLFCLSRPEVTTISVGAAAPEDFSEHLKVLPLLGTSEELLRRIDLNWQEAMQNATGHRRPDALWHKLPGWDKTPGYINMPFILWLSNLAQGWGLTEYARSRYQSLGHDVSWVPGHNGATLEQFDLADLLQRKTSLAPDEIIALLRQAHASLAGATRQRQCPAAGA